MRKIEPNAVDTLLNRAERRNAFQGRRTYLAFVFGFNWTKNLPDLFSSVMKTPTSIALCVLVLVWHLDARAGETKDMRRPKKLIATGWDKADTETLLQNLEQMEKRPFDGVVIGVVGQIDEAQTCPLRYAFVNKEWKPEWFQPCIDQMKACKFKRFTDNFILIGANPGSVDWFDDEGWRNIVEHWRIGAGIARQGGFKGILFDPEPYQKPYAQFEYSAQAACDRHTFEEYYAKARERGRQVMQAVVGEYPDITIFCYFMNIVCSTATGRADPRQALATMGYGLLPAFIDGWLDAVPPTVTLVDGCERAYLFNSEQQYLEAALLIKGACQELVSPENRAKYRAQVQVGFGVYLDAYSNLEGSKYFIDGKGGPRVERLRANVCTALRVADEYVWIYGEKFRWWPTSNKRVNEQSWPEALPGCEEILRFARNPIEYARSKIAELEEQGKLVNLARNGDFASAKAPAASSNRSDPDEEWKEGRPPAGWHAWQAKESKGKFAWDRENGAAGKGSALASGVTDGCFIQSYEAAPGERYAVRALRRIEGTGEARIRIRWQTPEGRWTLESQDKCFYYDGPAEEWRPPAGGFGVVVVPEGVGKLVILLGVSGQNSPDDRAWFDDVGLYRLD